MNSKLNRNLFYHLNRYQKALLYPVILACIIGCFSSLLTLLYIYYPDDFRILNKFSLKTIKEQIPLIVFIFMTILIILVFWAYYVSNRILGPHTRVVRELDNVLAGKSKGPILPRKGDQMFEEILSRVNKLIK